jgi:hypothetical protein
MSDEPNEALPAEPSLAPEVSPLLEADPNSLNELIVQRIDDIFNKKPILLTDEDLKFQVEYYQRERLRFRAESLAKESKEKKPRATGRKVPTSVAGALSAGEDIL